MKYYFIFLLISFLCTFVIKPNSKSQIWISAILIPLICMIVIICFAILSHKQGIIPLSAGYITGSLLAQAIIPAIISGIVINFQLKKKIINNKVVFPKTLFIFLIISLAGVFAEQILENRSKKFTEEFMKIYQEPHSN